MVPRALLRTRESARTRRSTGRRAAAGQHPADVLDGQPALVLLEHPELAAARCRCSCSRSAGAFWTLVLTSCAAATKRRLRLEFLGGGFLAWLVITLTPHHDIRYGMPLLGYLGGDRHRLDRMPAARVARIAAITCSRSASRQHARHHLRRRRGSESRARRTRSRRASRLQIAIVFDSTNGFLASAPSRDGDVPGLLEALRREGVRTVTWSFEQSEAPDFSFEGLEPLARIAELAPVITQGLQYAPLRERRDARTRTRGGTLRIAAARVSATAPACGSCATTPPLASWRSTARLAIRSSTTSAPSG